MTARRSRSLDPAAGVEYWHDTLVSRLNSESDRAAVIMSAAVLEDAIENLLRDRLVAPSGDVDPLFDVPYAPASSFRAKIELGYRVGVLSELDRNTLDKIREIRNSFAHDVQGCSFADQSVSARVAHIAALQGAVEANPAIRANFPPGARGDYEMTVSYLLWILASTFGAPKRITSLSSASAVDIKRATESAEATP